MGIFNEFFKKEKPIFTGSRFGFGSSSAPTGPTASVVGDFFEFQVWGGGGGSGGSSNVPGGGGAYVSVKYNILKGTTLKFIVGSGGRYTPRGVNDVAYGGGGAVGPLNYPSSTGAGCSGIFITPANIYLDADSPAADRVTDSPTPSPSGVVQPGFSAANALIIAAGGGGAAYDGGGGGGGITAGGDGEPTPDTGAYGRGGTWGGAGTDTGAGGGPSPRGGGLGFGGESSGGGGGGSGLYGGSAGTNGGTVASGGGGASYYWTTQSKPPAFVSYQPGSIVTADGNPGFTASNKGQVGGGAAPNNPTGGFGKGNGPNANGGDGRIAYRKHDSYSLLPQAEWVILDYTGSTQTLVV
tara:strand:+ start:37 stop:1095 length:1059 start_codon:yes stop_codon:yes gene_type:complete